MVEEAEFRAEARIRPLIIAAIVCLAIGAGTTILGVVIGEAPVMAFVGSFVAVPFIILVFLAVRVIAGTPTVIVSDHGLETTRDEVQRVVLWPEVAAVWLDVDDRSTTLVYLPTSTLDDDAADPVALPAIPSPRASDAQYEWDDLLRRYAGDRYQGIKQAAGLDTD